MGKKLVSDEKIIESYNRLKNVWLVAKEVGLCGQTVHERTVRLGIQKPMNKFTEKDDAFLTDNYSKYIMKGKLQDLADEMGRTKQFICRQAKRLGLTDNSRKKSIIEEYKPQVRSWEGKIHPRGMLGKKHSQETIDILCIRSQANADAMTEETKSAKS